jgi:ubiquinone biosynthesis protein COQ9
LSLYYHKLLKQAKIAALCPSHQQHNHDRNYILNELHSEARVNTVSAKTSDLTPEEIRIPLMRTMLAHVPFDGWSTTALNNAAQEMGITAEFAELAFPSGAIEALSLHLEITDQEMTIALEVLDLPSLKIRDRITLAIRTRLEQSHGQREAVRRGLIVLALPQNMVLASKALWRTADAMWRAAGDISTDHNWYTKRATLSAVYSAVLLFWLNDDSENQTETWEFLDRRIEDVMKIETAKYKFRQSSANFPSLARFLGRLRYPGT